METVDYIETMKSKSRLANHVAARQSMCYFLKKNDVSCKCISEVMGIDVRMVYINYYRIRDLLEVNDPTAIKYIEEAKSHKINIIPITLDGSIQSVIVGHKLLIDDIIY